MSQTIDQAVLAKLNSITELTALLGTISGTSTPAIFKSFVPQTYSFANQGAALTYSLPTDTPGHVLAGSDGTSLAQIQLDAWGFTEGTVKQILEAIRNALDGAPINPWGDGTCRISRVIKGISADMDEPPKAGSDQVLYRSFSEYTIGYYVSIPTLS
jgi:hypothetical protein